MKFFVCAENTVYKDLFNFLLQNKKVKMSCYEKVGSYEFAMFELDESVVNGICADTSGRLLPEGMKLYWVGSDSNIYAVSSDGVEFVRKYKGGLLAYRMRMLSIWLKIHNDARIYRKDEEFFKKSSERISVQRRSLFFPTFSRCLFKDSQDFLRHFRFYEPKGDGEFPLIIYLHGAGLQIGSDNWKQMFEYDYVNRGLKRAKLKKSCYIAVSQLPVYDDYNSASHARYLTELIDFVGSKGKLDRSRIYIVGTSRGGYGVLRQLVMLPDTFAAAISCAGFMFMDFEENSENETDIAQDYEKIARTPLWLEHSSDDDNVPVDRSDVVYERLKELGADVRYTRDSKGKHFAHRKFYKSGIWVHWLLKNKR